MSSSKFHGVFSSLLKDASASGTAASGSHHAQDDHTGEDKSVPVAQSAGQIAVDVYEDGDYLVIKAPIAGVKLSDLDIDVDENVITIRGERKQCDEVHDDNYVVQECFWGTFERSVTLPHPVNPQKVKATFSKDGVLKVLVPKEARRKVKIVKINEGG